MNLELIKCHGSGNDFLLIDEISNNYTITEEQRAELARNLCSREESLGADGILFVQNSEKADGRMRVFNSDGSEASMCGNGLRCVARYICEQQGKEEAVIETMKAILRVGIEENIYPGIPTYKVEISPVSFQLEDLPLRIERNTLINDQISSLSNELVFTALAVPNPHLVSVVESVQIQSDLQKNISQSVNGPNELFPDGVNVSFVKILDGEGIYVRTYERGVGFTNACGTAMSASTLVTTLLGISNIETPVNVFNNGGMVRCIVHKNQDDYTIDLIGNATYLYQASLYVHFDGGKARAEILSKQELLEEESYSKLQEHAQTVVAKYIQN